MKTKLKDNVIFRWIMIPLCIGLCFFGKFIPIEGLSQDAVGVLFIFLGSLILWLTIGIDWPSLLCILSLGFLDTIGFSKVISSSFGSSTFVFLLFTFVCTYALSKTSLIKRIAVTFVNSRLARKNGYYFLFLFLFSVLLVGLFTSPSVLFVVILPILNQILEVTNINKKDKIAKFLMIGLGFTVSISSGMTPIAHVFPILAINAAGIDVSPIAYMGLAIPVGLILFILMFILLVVIIRPDVSVLKNTSLEQLKNELPKVNKKDITVLSIFIIVLLLWIVPSLFRDLSEDFYQMINKYGSAMPPLLGTVALCIIRIDNEPLLKIEDALKNGIPWSALIMCASTLALGSALTNADIGLQVYLTDNLSPILNNLPAIALLIIFASWAALQTNLSSNMVTATLVATVAGTILVGTQVNISLEAIVCVIGMLASFAFATPPSMPHIAIISGSESCTTKDVLLLGSIMMIFAVVVSLLVGYPLGTLIF